jgi:hypothetical protein
VRIQRRTMTPFESLVQAIVYQQLAGCRCNAWREEYRFYGAVR